MDNGKNVCIEGLGKISPGEYDDVAIEGVGSVKGDLSSQSMDVQGIGKVKGNLYCDSLSVQGTMKIYGECTFNNMRSQGIVKFLDKAKGYEAINEGVMIAKDIQCERIESEGYIKIQNSLNAGSIHIEYYRKSRVAEVYGENILIKISDGRGRSSFLDRVIKAKFRSEIIEGDDITIEGVRAEMVRGKNVTIGKGCRIGTVEYHENIEVDPSARIGECRKID